MLLAIDGSTKKTGIAAFDSGGKLLGYKTIRAKNSEPVLKRIEFMINEIEKIIIDKNITKCCIEEVPLKKGSMATFKALFYLQGFLIKMLEKHNVKYNFLEPSEWRRICGIKNGRGIKREEVKQLDIAFVKEKFDIIANDDVCDAISIGYAYFKKKGE